MLRRDSVDDGPYLTDSSGPESDSDVELPSPSPERVPSPLKQLGELKPQPEPDLKLEEETELEPRLGESLIDPAESDTSQVEDEVAIDDGDEHRGVK